MKRAVIAAGLALGLTFMAPGIGTAQAVPLTCEHRSAAHVKDHGGLAEDSAWHVAHGELPTCGEEQSSETRTGQDEGFKTEQDNQPDESKSRYCRQHWYC